MKIRLLCIGQKMPDWVNAGYQDYAKRLTGQLPLELVELPMSRRNRTDRPADIQRHCETEGQTLLNAFGNRGTLIALEVGGRNLSTEQLARQLAQWQQAGQDVALAIGGPDGLSAAVQQAAAWHWSLSALTLPHPLVRIILIEQLYRAHSLLIGHPYHRA